MCEVPGRRIPGITPGGLDSLVPDSTSRARIILTTTSRDEGPAIARDLVEKRLAACVNITEIRSIYRWEGSMCDDPEVLLIIKTTTDRVSDAISAIRSAHSYELPEIIVVPVIDGNPPYLTWLDGETHP